jgi:hypothetical protein
MSRKKLIKNILIGWPFAVMGIVLAYLFIAKFGFWPFAIALVFCSLIMLSWWKGMDIKDD